MNSRFQGVQAKLSDYHSKSHSSSLPSNIFIPIKKLRKTVVHRRSRMIGYLNVEFRTITMISAYTDECIILYRIGFNHTNEILNIRKQISSN